MADLGLSFSSRKALSVHLGESAGTEIANVIQQLVKRIEQLERTKVDITPIVRADAALPVLVDGRLDAIRVNSPHFSPFTLVLCQR